MHVRHLSMRAGSTELPSFTDPPVSRITHPGFATRSVEELKQHLAMFDPAAVLEIYDPGSFSEYRHRVVKLADITLSLSSIISSGRYQLRFSPRDEYCLGIPLNAYGSFAQGPGPAVLVGPTHQVVKYWQESSNWVVLHVPADMFDRHIAHHLSEPLALPAQLVKPLLQLIMITFTSTVDERSAMIGRAVGASLDAMLLALLDQILSMNGAEQPPPDRPGGPPYYMLRAERHMRENLGLAFVLDDVAALAGVCSRTLQYGFRKHHDTTPLGFFKRLRLEKARDKITAGGAGKSLSGIAWDLGYTSASHFSDDYRSMFGESPSSTARRLRAAR